jgi:glucosyl-dolichyl phosphate glucuronosyltransferase
MTESLDSVAMQNMPQSVEWEVLVVDNNSTDKTREVVEEYCRRHTRFSYVFEPKQGLSHARNAGVENARGQILAFTDDDIFADPDWLRNLTSSLLDRGEWDGAGGRIVPVWNGALPKWLSETDFLTSGPFTGFDAGPVPCELKREPYGGNAAFYRELFEKFGGYRTDLGRSSDNLLGHEDLDLGRRFLAAGARLRYEPKAIIRHPAPEDRMKKSYILRWCYWDSHSEVTETGLLEPGISIAGVPLYLFRRLVRWALQWLISISAPKRFFCECKMWRVAGYIAASYRASKRRHSQTLAASRASAE